MTTTKIFFSALLITIFFSCTSNDKKEEATESVVTDTLTAPPTGDTTRTIVNHSLIWNVTVDSADKDKLQPPAEGKLDTFSSAHLVELLNQNYPDIKIDLKKVSHDTIYVKIPDSRRLANELGNTGAQNYLAAATYTLTELKNIKFVNIEMEPGDHAEPGVYSRQDFKNLR